MSDEKTNYDRPFITYDEQIEKLKDKYGLLIEDEDFARKALSTISYYDLINGYQECFKPNGKYINGVSIEYLYNFHFFDKGFQNILIKHSLLIENIFKTKMSYIVAKNVGVDSEVYLNPRKYKEKNNSIKSSVVLKNISCVIQKELKYIDNPTRHYLKTKNHLPPWILFKNVNFSDVIDLYSILSTRDNYELTNEIIPTENLPNDVKVQHLINSLTIIRKFRNKIAHNLKFITYDCPSYKLNKKVIQVLSPSELVEKDDVVRGVYKFFLAIITFYNDDPYMLNRFLYDVMIHLKMDEAMNKNKTTFNDYHIITHLPPDLVNRLENCINNPLRANRKWL